MQLAARSDLPVLVMICQRMRKFCSSKNELDIMCADIAAAQLS